MKNNIWELKKTHNNFINRVIVGLEVDWGGNSGQQQLIQIEYFLILNSIAVNEYGV